MAIARTRVLKGLFLAATGGLAATFPAAAQSDKSPGVEEVVVTAQRRVELARDVPITITAVNSRQLQEAGVQSLSGIAQLAPAVRFDTSGSFNAITIRGVGTSVVSSGAGANVGVYVDGFYNPGPEASDFQLLNVDSIQVLKGPQGTLFGHNTTGGAILVSTKKPSKDTSGTLLASYGSYNTQRYEGYFTTGLNENIAVDVGGAAYKSDGYYHDIVSGSHTVGAIQNWSVRGGILANLSDNFSVLVRYLHSEQSDPTGYLANAYVDKGVAQNLGAVWNATPGFPHAIYSTKPFEVAQLGNIFYHARTNTVQLTLNYDFNWASLTSYSQYSKQKTINHGEFGNAAIQVGPGHFEPFLQIIFPVDNRVITQEFLLKSKSEGRLKWTAGLFYMDFNEPFGLGTPGVILSSTGGPYFSVANSNTDDISIAGYFDATYQVLPNLYVSAGVRYSHDEVRDAYYDTGYFGPAISRVYLPTLKGNKAAPRVVLRYTLDSNSNVYASWSRGDKSAIYNVGGAQSTPVLPEKIDAFEVGYKYGRQGLSFDLSGYYYNYSNLQVAHYTETASVVQNAAKARVYGFEAQAQYQVIDDLNLSAGMAYTNGKYTRFAGSPFFTQCLNVAGCRTGAFYGGFILDPVDQFNKEMIRSPKFTATLGARYTAPLMGGDATFSGNLYYSSKFFFDSSNQFFQKGFATLNLRAEWTSPSGRYTIAVYGQNVTDTRYFSQVAPYNTGIGAVWAPPATVGGEFKLRFGS